MTIQAYTLQMHLSKAEFAQDIQNRFLLYNQVQAGGLAEEEKAAARVADERVADTPKPEGMDVEPDRERRSPRARLVPKPRSTEEQQGEGGEGREDKSGHLIDVLA